LILLCSSLLFVTPSRSDQAYSIYTAPVGYRARLNPRIAISIVPPRGDATQSAVELGLAETEATAHEQEGDAPVSPATRDRNRAYSVSSSSGYARLVAPPCSPSSVVSEFPDSLSDDLSTFAAAPSSPAQSPNEPLTGASEYFDALEYHD
jgi:hypothetical protein